LQLDTPYLIYFKIKVFVCGKPQQQSHAMLECHGTKHRVVSAD